MTDVLVTGGTGILGTALVPRLLTKGHGVRVLSRQASPSVPPGATAVQGDVRTGEGLDAAVAGVDTVVHAATNARRRARATEVDGTRNLTDAARKTGAHVIYVSIVGVDRHRLPYYKAKWEAEQVVEASGAPWTILRATQFHNLLDDFLAMRVLPLPKRIPFQPVDVGEVSDAFVDLVEAGPSGRAPDIGGPDVLTIGEMNESRRLITGKGALLIRVPAVGLVRDFVEGRHLCPDRAVGRITWEQWLQMKSPATDRDS
jgi:uncharacterized protein YbjT (DUF2867 family)